MSLDTRQQGLLDDLDTLAVDEPLRHRPNRWIDGYNPENETQWNREGRGIARRNLNWSIYVEFLGFVVWQLWSVAVVAMPAAGFSLSTSQQFWLISVPSLVGATMRFPYTFMVPIFGGRMWTVISALLLLLPVVGMGMCLGNPDTPFGVLLAVAALAGFGGGNFASSMTNITYYFPAKEKGWALGLNAAGGHLGSAVAQFTVPIVITAGGVLLTGGPMVSLAGWFWVPFILLGAVGAYYCMNSLSHATADVSSYLAALKHGQLWVIAVLYIGTFGSFMGFASVFPKLIADTFPQFSAFTIGAATLSLAFLGALVGSLARPYGGKLADKFGGARPTIAAFAVMAIMALAIIGLLRLGNFWLFLLGFLVLFIASGMGNGSTYRMIPTAFSLAYGDDQKATRAAASSLGIISAIGAYGGFLIPQVLRIVHENTGGYDGAFIGFAAGYLVLLAITWGVYARKGTTFGDGRV